MTPFSCPRHCWLLPQFFSCATETPISCLGSLILQGLVDIFGGRAQYSSKRVLDSTFFHIYRDVWRILNEGTNRSQTGSLTVDGWSASYATPILGMTWHYCDDIRRLQRVSIACLKIGKVSNTGTQLCAMMEDNVPKSKVVGSDRIRGFPATRVNETATALQVDLPTLPVQFGVSFTFLPFVSTPFLKLGLHHSDTSSMLIIFHYTSTSTKKHVKDFRNSNKKKVFPKTAFTN